MFLTIFLITVICCGIYFFFQHLHVKNFIFLNKVSSISRYMFIAGWLSHFAILLFFLSLALWLYSDLFYRIDIISSLLFFFLLFFLIPFDYFKESLLFINVEKKINKRLFVDNNSPFIKNYNSYFFININFFIIVAFLTINIVGYYMNSNQYQYYSYIILLLILLFLFGSWYFMQIIKKKEFYLGCIHNNELKILFNNLMAAMSQKETPSINWNNSKKVTIKNNLNECISINFLNPVKFNVCETEDMPKLSSDYTLFKVHFSSYLNNEDKVYSLISPYSKRLIIASLTNYSSCKLIIVFLYYIIAMLLFPFILENHIVIGNLLLFIFFLLAGISIIIFVFSLFFPKKGPLLLRKSYKASFFEYDFFEKISVVLFLLKEPKK